VRAPARTTYRVFAMSTSKQFPSSCALARITSFTGQLIGAVRLAVAALAILTVLSGGLILVALAAVSFVVHSTNSAVSHLLRRLRPFARAQQRIALRRFD
jgi:hypothetical protein